MIYIDKTSTETLLSIKNLRTSFRIEGEYYAAVDDLNLEIRKNEVFAIVGESGCGKSALALSIPMLHNSNYTKVEGEINFEGKNIIELTEPEKNKIRG
ncbi:MAG: ATP-binding cassette domain-containing protein, partial [Defluviitaleaceae bacterium]|nr:ATP-binding cassette domain-containing protein [Defluviitaleaceae bacterium]